MKRAVKWMFIIVGGLLILAIAALLLIPSFVDVQRYRAEIETRASKIVGVPVTLGGDLRLSVFPWVGVAVSDVQIGNPEGFQEKQMLSIKSFEARVKLLPLISRDVQVDRFILNAPRIVLETGKDGRRNWEALGKKTGAVSPKTPKEAEKQPTGKGGEGLPIKALAISELTIKDGLLLWIDQSKGERREVSELTLRLKDVSLDRPIHLTLSARIDGQPVSLDGQVGPVGKDPGRGTIPLELALKALKELDVTVKGKITDPATNPSYELNLAIAPFSPRKITAALGQKFSLKTTKPNLLEHLALKAHVIGDTKSIAISEGNLNFDQSKLNFSLDAKNFDKPDVKFDLHLDEIDLDDYLPPSSESKAQTEKKPRAGGPKKEQMDFALLRKLTLNGKIQIGSLKAQGLQMQDLNLHVSGKDGLFQVDPLALKLDQSRIALKGAVDVRQDVPSFDLSFQVDPLSPRKIMAAMGKPFPVKTADPQAVNRVALQGKLKGTQQSVAITDGSLELDKTKMNFWVKAKDLSKPDVAFDLSLDQIDLDAYLPPSSESNAQTEKKPEAAGPKKETLDYAPLRKLAIEGKIQALALKVGGTQVQDLNLSVSGKGGFFRLDPLTAKVYQGNLSAKGSLDVREDQAKSNLTIETKGLQIGPLLRDQLKKDVLEGALQSKVTIAMTGDDADQIKRSLNGDGALIFNDGAIKGIDLPGMMRNVEAKFGLVKKEGERPRTDFSELKSQFTITNGVFNTLNTTMMSPVLRVVATGKADLVKETIDFTVEPKFVGTLKGQGDTKERSGVVVPVLVAGTFSSPTFRPDLVKMLKQDFTKVLPEAGKLIDRLKEQQDQGKEALKKTLEKGVLGQKQVPPEAPKEGSSQQEKPKTPEEQAKELLKGLPFSK